MPMDRNANNSLSDRCAPLQFKFALNEFNQIQPKKFKESVEFDKILKTIDKLSNV